MAKVSVVYHSGYGHTKRMAESVAEGAGATLVAIDADHRALTPCYTYADGRCAAEAEELRRELDEAQVQQRTGTRIHTSYLAPRLRWLARTRPDVFAAAARFVSLGEYVQLRLLGHTAAGTPAAAWSGLLNRHTGDWDVELLAAAGIDAARLSPVQDPGVPLPPPGPHAVDRWPALADDTAGLSHADLVRAAESAAKSAILTGNIKVIADDIRGALTSRRAASLG